MFAEIKYVTYIKEDRLTCYTVHVNIQLQFNYGKTHFIYLIFLP